MLFTSYEHRIIRYRSKSLGPNLGLDSSNMKIFYGFSKSIQANPATVTQLRHDRFLKNSFQFISHPAGIADQ
jgi:hypothetical protein